MKNKAVALIIVIFAMMVLAVLCWTLANLLSGDFGTNLAYLESERALYLAEAGSEWGVSRLSGTGNFSFPGFFFFHFYLSFAPTIYSKGF